MFLAAIINLFLSVVLAKPLGLAGIIVATSLSKIATLVWYEPRTFYRKVFHKPLRRYWEYQGGLIIICSICVVLSAFISKSIQCSFLGMFIKIFISACCTAIVFIISTRNSM